MDNGDFIRMFGVFYKTKETVVNWCAKRGKRPRGSSLYNGLYREAPSVNVHFFQNGLQKGKELDIGVYLPRTKRCRVSVPLSIEGYK